MVDFFEFLANLCLAIGVILLFLLGIAISIRIAKNIMEIIHYYRLYKMAHDTEGKFDVFSVESVVESFTEKNIDRFNTLYTVQVRYTVGEAVYFTEVKLLNRGSLRVGQTIILLCDNDNVNNVVVQGGDESYALKHSVHLLIFEIITLIVYIALEIFVFYVEVGE